MAQYIEREKAIEIAMQYCPDDDGSCSNALADLRDLLDEIESIPAANVRPVVRGRWVVSRTDYGWNGAEFPTHCKCTECGREVPYQDKGKFCPNCGAWMEES